MLHYNKLTTKKKAFIDQLYNLINTQFEKQEKKTKLIIEEQKEKEDRISLNNRFI